MADRNRARHNAAAVRQANAAAAAAVQFKRTPYGIAKDLARLPGGISWGIWLGWKRAYEDFKKDMEKSREMWRQKNEEFREKQKDMLWQQYGIDRYPTWGELGKNAEERLRRMKAPRPRQLREVYIPAHDGEYLNTAEEDPIKYTAIPRGRGVLVNRQWYDARALAEWFDQNPRAVVPHSMRELSANEQARVRARAAHRGRHETSP